MLTWDGQSWTSAGIGWWGPFNGYQVNALEVFDDGTGPALYAAGASGSAGGVPAANIARWDGHRWNALGRGITGYVYDMAVYDDGRGESLFVAGLDIRVRSYAGQSMSRPLVQWVGRKGQCYPDCDNDGVLTAVDLSCFQNEYARSNPYVDCDRDVVFTVADFSCFVAKFTDGCR